MKPFRERNPVIIGLVMTVIIAGLLVFALESGNIFESGQTVKALFTDASGLQPGDDVLLAGVQVGKVKSVDIDGDHVEATFTVNSDQHLGNTTRADIKIETLLGKMYIAVTPDGSGSLSGDIPASRTTTPLQVTDAFIGLGRRAGKINAAQLARAFDTVASAFKGTPAHVRASLTGLSRLSNTISSRNTQIQNLLAATRNVTQTLAQRDAQVVKLINDSNLILTTVRQQAAVIHRLLIDTVAVSKQLSGLVKDNERILGPALANLHRTVQILNDNQANLRRSIHLAAPFIRDFTDVLGNGRWFESILGNVPNGLGDSCISGLASSPICLGGGKS